MVKNKHILYDLRYILETNTLWNENQTYVGCRDAKEDNMHIKFFLKTDNQV